MELRAEFQHVAPTHLGHVVGDGVVVAEVVVGAETRHRGETTRERDCGYALRIPRKHQCGLDVRRVDPGGQADRVAEDAAPAPGPDRFIVESRGECAGPAKHQAAARRVGLGGRDAGCKNVGEEPSRLDRWNRIVQVAAAERELRAQIVIDPDDLLPGVEDAAQGHEQVVAVRGSRKLGEDVFDVGLRQRTDIGDAASRVRAGAEIGRQRGADGVRENALALVQRRYLHVARVVINHAAELLGEKEERLVPAVVDTRNIYRSAGGVTEVVVAEWRPRHLVEVVEKIVGVQLVVPQELVGGAMPFVGPAFGDDADLPATGAAKLRRVRAAYDLDLFNGVDAGVLLDGNVGTPVHVIGAVHGPIVLALPGAVDRQADNVVAATGIRGADVDLI